MKPNYTLNPKPYTLRQSRKLCLYSEGGQIFILALIVLSLIIVSTLVIVAGSLNFFQNSKYTVESTQALNLAEAGVDKAVASLNSSGGTYNGEEEVALGNGSYSIKITTKDPSTKLIESTGYIPNKASPKSKRTVKLQISKGTGVSFNYGVQVGEGGLVMSNNSRVNGSIYSNGNIEMDNGSVITGDAYVAGGTEAIANQQTECAGANCSDFIFGKTVSGNNQLDVAQSFRPSVSAVLNKVSLKLKKVGSPSNVIIRILADSGGSPNKNSVITSGTLSASLVTSQYGFVDVTFNSNPVLNANSLYWIVIDTASNNTNYWQWSSDTLQGYTQGQAKWSANWQAASPVWTNIPADLGFKVFMGGVITSITGANNSTVTRAYANTLNSLNVTQAAYYQSQSNITVAGQNCTNNANCHSGSTDPATQALPISEGNIQAWQQEAESVAVYTGNITGCRANLGPGKYVGNVTLTNNCAVIVSTPIWITGNLILDNGSSLRLNSTYGASSGIIVVDGTVKLSNNGKLYGSGTNNSYLTLISNFDSMSNGTIAIEADNGSSSSILYANKGLIKLSNNANLQELCAWKIQLDNGATINYNSGLASLFFTSSPSGSYSVIKGSYQSQ